jgi:glycosyltransferase involved in cell wall biosynthesis
MEDKPLVSVIIPTFNRANFIARAVNNALKQSYHNIEIIVVDDASTDFTSAVVQDIDDPRVHYFCLDKNSGPSTARNRGVGFSQGQFVAFLDSDDEWDTKKIKLQIAAIKQQADPYHVVCYTQATVVESNKTYLLPTRGITKDEPVGDYVLCGNDGLIQTSSVMLSHELAIAYPFPTAHAIFEDWDLFLRLDNDGVKWLYLDQPLISWHNDARQDRLTSSQHDGSEWLDEHKHFLSKKARHAFSVKGIAYPLIRSRQKKLYCLKLLFLAFLGNEIPFAQFLKYSIKIFTPPALIRLLKELAHSRKQMNQ